MASGSQPFLFSNTAMRDSETSAIDSLDETVPSLELKRNMIQLSRLKEPELVGDKRSMKALD